MSRLEKDRAEYRELVAKIQTKEDLTYEEWKDYHYELSDIVDCLTDEEREEFFSIDFPPIAHKNKACFLLYRLRNSRYMLVAFGELNAPERILKDSRRILDRHRKEYEDYIVKHRMMNFM